MFHINPKKPAMLMVFCLTLLVIGGGFGSSATAEDYNTFDWSGGQGLFDPNVEMYKPMDDIDISKFDHLDYNLLNKDPYGDFALDFKLDGLNMDIMDIKDVPVPEDIDIAFDPGLGVGKSLKAFLRGDALCGELPPKSRLSQASHTVLDFIGRLNKLNHLSLKSPADYKAGIDEARALADEVYATASGYREASLGNIKKTLKFKSGAERNGEQVIKWMEGVGNGAGIRAMGLVVSQYRTANSKVVKQATAQPEKNFALEYKKLIGRGIALEDSASAAGVRDLIYKGTSSGKPFELTGIQKMEELGSVRNTVTLNYALHTYQELNARYRKTTKERFDVSDNKNELQIIQVELTNLQDRLGGLNIPPDDDKAPDLETMQFKLNTLQEDITKDLNRIK